MSRTLIDGTVVEDYSYPIDITIHTKCPAKWKLTDMETGIEYIGTRYIENKKVEKPIKTLVSVDESNELIEPL